MIGLILMGGLRDGEWDGKLLHRIANKTILEHTISIASSVEACLKIIVCLDYKDSSSVTGTAFNTPAIPSAAIQSDARISFLFSDKKDWWGKAYHACIEFGLTNACIIPADSPITPPWLIKESIYRHMTLGQPVFLQGYPAGIDVRVLPFHIIANMYRYAGFDDLLAGMTADIGIKAHNIINDPKDASLYIYDKIEDVAFKTRADLPMLDALLSDLSNGDELSDLLREWDEQERSV